MSDQAIAELTKLLNESTEVSRQRIFYVLDYAVNYFKGERRIPKITHEFPTEVQKLKEMEVVEEAPLYWKGNKYLRIFVKAEAAVEISRLLKERYYPIFTLDAVTVRIRESVISAFPAAARLWSGVQQFKIDEYTLSEPSLYNQEAMNFGEKLMAAGLCYLIGYWSVSWISYSDEIIFRKEPIDVRDVFLEIVENEMTTALSSFSAEMKWCLFLKHVNPKADERFFLKNSTTSFLPNQIKNALAKLPSPEIAKSKEAVESILTEQRKRLSETIRSLINRDPTTVAVLGTLFTLSREEEKYRKVDSFSLGKIKETLRNYDDFEQYIAYFKSLGIVLESTNGEILIPKITWEIFCDEIKGRAVEVKIFESELDGQSFLEETMSKATSSVKIWDPYLSTKTLTILERSIRSNKVQIDILSSHPEVIPDIIHLLKEGVKIAGRFVYTKKEKSYWSPWHDRYLMIDTDNVWHIGPSLHAAGQKKWESAELFARDLGRLIADAFKFNFRKNKEDWDSEGYTIDKVGLEGSF
ncbi:MAG: hypothetical protein WCD81_12320 [Candidatus Bathyarchaeia archaeon]